MLVQLRQHPPAHIILRQRRRLRRETQRGRRAERCPLNPLFKTETIQSSGHLGFAENGSDVEVGFFEHDKSFVAIGRFVLIALDLREALIQVGADRIGGAATVEEALVAVAGPSLTAAIVALRLNRRWVRDVVQITRSSPAARIALEPQPS